MSNLQDQLAAALTKNYPWTATFSAAIEDKTAIGDPSRQLEFYAPHTDENPSSVPEIQVFNTKMGAADLMGELYSHWLPKIDTNVAAARSQLIKSMTPQQVASIKGDYERDKKNGLVNNLDFSSWLQGIGGDSFFRGYATGQWSPSDYTPQQKALLENLGSYLTKTYAHVPIPRPKP